MGEGPNKNLGKQLLNKRDEALFFRCKNEQDLAVLSSLLQDAMINNLDFHFSKKEKTFLFVANRFCWENVASKTKEKVFQRVLSGVNIQNVTSVKHKNFISKNDARTALFYNLLTVEYDRQESQITLIFSLNACVKLDVSKLDIFIKDVEEPYPTQKIPDHFK